MSYYTMVSATSGEDRLYRRGAVIVDESSKCSGEEVLRDLVQRRKAFQYHYEHCPGCRCCEESDQN